MGFFSRKAICSICNSEVGLNRFQIKDKEWICPACFKKCEFGPLTPIKTMTKEDILAAMDKTEERSQFVPTKKVGFHLEVDDKQKKWVVPGMFGGKKGKVQYNYSDIVGFELLEDDHTITKGGLGSAIAGGLLFGGTGAVVGGVTGKRNTKKICNTLKIKDNLK